ELAKLALIVDGRELSLRILRHLRECELWIVREEQPTATLHEILEQRGFLVDEQLGIAVVAHRDRQVHPRTARDEIGREHDGTTGHRDLGQQETGRVTRAAMKP